MSRALAPLLAIAALSGCSTVPGSAAVAWSECARAEALALLAQGVHPSWPHASELPAGESMEVVYLGADPPDAIHDALMRTLYLARRHNAFYVHQTGGIAGIDFIHGPVSLHGRCPPPKPGARLNSSSRPTTLRGAS